jgi:hypothetical protein
VKGFAREGTMSARTAILMVMSVSSCAGTNVFRSQPLTDITVQVYLAWDLSPPAGYSSRAKACASQRLAQAGIALEWHDGPPDRDAGPEVIGITVVAEAPREYDSASRRDALAAARPYATGPMRIQVFYDRLMAYGRNCGGHGSVVAGHVLAHEIGHVLEGVARHSQTGLMRARWSVDDMWQMMRQGLPFAREDLYLMRSRFHAVSRPGR